MRLYIIRHADPNYEIDGLTEVGRIEAELLSERLAALDVKKIYTSPLGRARATAKPTEEKFGMTAEVVELFREFSWERIDLPYKKDAIAWDLLPSYVKNRDDLYSPTRWREAEPLKSSNIPAAYDAVCAELDRVIAEMGYVREGHAYRVERSNHDTYLIFCHYGVAAVMLSHLLGTSPYSLWQNTVMLPSSVTVLYTEEREEGIASLRMQAFGDTSHLYKGGREPSFSARFCECFLDDTRHE